MAAFYLFFQQTSSQIFLLVVAFIVTFATLDKASTSYMDGKSEEVKSKLDSADRIQDSMVNLLETNDRRMKMLSSQYFLSKRLKEYFIGQSVIFNSNYYKFSLSFIVSSILLTIAIFLVAQSGWSGATLPVKIFFLLAAATSSLYYLLPMVINSKENTQQNMAKVKIYETIQMDIISSCFSSADTTAKKRDSLIIAINDRIKNNYDFIVNIDPGKVNVVPFETFTKVVK